MQRLIAAVLVVFCTLAAAAQPASTDLLDRVYAAVKKADPNGKYDGKLYSYSTTNALTGDWLWQTPKVWGARPNEVVPYGHYGNALATDLSKIIGNATSTVDISTLYPAPDGFFQGNIVAGLKGAMAKGHHLTVRILVGHFTDRFDATTYLSNLRKDIGLPDKGSLSIYAAGQKVGIKTWNHSKIVSVDGRVAIVGGHNLWPVDVLGPQPVHDLSMRVSGPAAAAADKFLDVLWAHVCYWNGHGVYPNYSRHWQTGRDTIDNTCLSTLVLPAPIKPGSVAVLGVARAPGVVPDGGDLANPSDAAMIAAFEAATKSIKISQQDLVLGTYSPRVVVALAQALERNVNIEVVLTNYMAKAGNGGLLAYSTGATRTMAIELMRLAMKHHTKLHDGEISRRLRNKFHIYTLRFGPADAIKWDNGFPFANHAKMFVIDDRLFYIGSSNLYPADHEEYGYFVQDAVATKTLLNEYWNPMWRWSAR